MTARWTVIPAAAGTGKTTRLVQEYLRLLADGCDPRRIVAITFTRKSAGELLERVSEVLWAVLAHRHGDTRPAALDALARRGKDLGFYGSWAPADAAVIEQALAALSEAPVSTIDSFVHTLLTEHLLDAALPLPDGTTVPLDLPLPTGADPQPALEEAARRVLIEWGDAGDPRLDTLTRHHSLADLRVLATQPPPVAPPSATKELLGALAHAFTGRIEPSRRASGLRGAVLEALGLRKPRATWVNLIATKLSVDGPAPSELATWLSEGGDAPPALSTLWPALAKKLPTAKARPWPPRAGEHLLAAMQGAGVADPRAHVISLLGKNAAEDPAAALQKSVNKGGQSYVAEAASWLVAGEGLPPAAFAAACANLKAPKRKEVPGLADLLFPSSELEQHLAAEGAPARELLLRELGLAMPTHAFEAPLRKKLLAGSEGLAGPLAIWLAGDDDAAPPVLVPALGGLNKAGRTVASARLLGTDPAVELEAWPVSLQVAVAGAKVAIDLEEVAKATKAPFDDPAAWGLADTLRSDLDALRRIVRSRGLRLAAERSSLGYEQLLDAAIALCRGAAGEATHPLRTRFDALLVDEVQDSSPAQIDLYEAMVATMPALKAIAVGDGRQSIYAFRGAEPQGLARLLASATVPEGAQTLRNWRSVPRLVDAQKSLFGPTLSHATDDQGLEPLEALDSLKAGRSEPAGAAARPVTIVTPLGASQGEEAIDPDDIGAASLELRAVERFAQHLRETWAERAKQEAAGEIDAGWRRESAAVLAPSWRKAGEACALLRGWLGPDEEGRPRAWVESGAGWTAGRVARDLRILLAAMLDRSNAVAWLGVWKHPMIGLSDRALALARGGHGLVVENGEVPAWLGHTGWLLDAQALTNPHDPRDIAAFERARPALCAAIDDLGRRGPAEAMEGLARTLRWRELLAVSPQDDALAHLELALDWIRDLEAAGQSTPEVLMTMTAEQGSDPPRLSLERPEPHVACMTVHGAKGLKWNDVLVIGVGRQPRDSVDPEPLAVRIAGRALQIVPGVLDPAGALAPGPDPHSGLFTALASRRKQEEAVRLAYVAITRAAESVTFSMPLKGSGRARKALVEAWTPTLTEEGTIEPTLDGVRWEPWQEPVLPSLPTGRAVTPTGKPLSTPMDPARSWIRSSPSSLSRGLTPTERKDLGLRVARSALADGKTHDGLDDFHQAPAILKADATRCGDIAHGWMAAWSFEGAPDRARAAAYLDRVWGMADATVADWLVALSARVEADANNPLLRLVRKPGVERFVEWSLLGESKLGDPEQPWLLAGSADLVLRDASAPKERRWTILDFKAGNKHIGSGRKREEATTKADRLLEEASLRGYAAQLEGYRAMLDGALQTRKAWAGEGVGDVGLWFPRRGSAMWWGPLARGDG
jgi:ATP-dependent exoDNAse (exonuclease V) beta subunit